MKLRKRAYSQAMNYTFWLLLLWNYSAVISDIFTIILLPYKYFSAITSQAYINLNVPLDHLGTWFAFNISLISLAFQLERDVEQV